MLGCRMGGDELGDTERITDGISGYDMAFAGFSRLFRLLLIIKDCTTCRLFFKT